MTNKPDNILTAEEIEKIIDDPNHKNGWALSELVEAGAQALLSKLKVSDDKLVEMLAKFDWESWRDKEHSVEWEYLSVYEKEPNLRDARKLLDTILSPYLSQRIIEAKKEGESKYKELAIAAQEVMNELAIHGGRIVPHLMDTDDNAGEVLRELVRQALDNKE